MYWKLRPSLTPRSRLWRTLAFRLTAGYALAGLVLVTLATASLYLLLVSELEKSTELFLGDKLHVLDTMLRADLGASDARTLVVASGADVESTLRAAEAAATRLNVLVDRGRSSHQRPVGKSLQDRSYRRIGARAGLAASAEIPRDRAVARRNAERTVDHARGWAIW